MTQGLRNTAGGGKEQKNGEEGCEMQTSELDVAINLLMNPSQLWLPVHDLCTT